jgi:hypothetical protein
MVSRGRVPGRPLTEPETRQLKRLLNEHDDAKRLVRQLRTELEDLVLECREAGASARGMAAVLGISPSTAQHWKRNAQRRRDQD